VTDVPKYLPSKRGRKQLAFNPEFVKLWEPYLDEGMSRTAVAEVFGVAATTVRKYYPDRGWDAKTMLEHSFTMRALNRV
jgi:hypothetical protein